MHYFIDGYNMLFRLMHADDNLQSNREQIIYELNKKISLVNMNVSVVFDAAFQLGERSRSHFKELEILFTAEGETADEFILEEIKTSSYPQQETVVTSDKKLAWWVRRHLAHTETVEDFITRLNKLYKKKLKQAKKEQAPSSPSSPSASPILVSKATKKSITPSSTATLEEYIDYYEQVFESHFQELLTQEKMNKPSKQSVLASKKTKKKKSLFPEELHPPVNAKTDMERWLKIFEENSPSPP